MSRITVEEIARRCHEQNRLYCESLGDWSQPTWDNAEDWMKESATNGVEARLRDPHAPYNQSHNNWYQHKLEQGWIYGPTKDASKKEHPCMVPFEDLPAEQKLKDFLFCIQVHFCTEEYELVR